MFLLYLQRILVIKGRCLGKLLERMGHSASRERHRADSLRQCHFMDQQETPEGQGRPSRKTDSARKTRSIHTPRVRAFCSGSQPCLRQEGRTGAVLAASKLSDGGTFSTMLEELEESGFIRRFASADTAETNALYQLIDNYTLFYYLCIKKNAFSDEHYWLNTCTSTSHNTWKGHAFERVCLQHVPQIKAALGISGVQTNVCSWFVRGSKEQRGAQIVVS